uniref:Uncharacterized protein n=1 Tax=Chromera velia CCMP2878 TaxID=1169474 RepID=A0A0G4HH64_9ALVE|eukprot:Cvel_6789.t1-p1 / transcript=Cvel_6789.t1 / gene=Cvel_6789 / organism=Chromera_velia_CCMP2878 / gene_product=hypothetical protein / transcript_product=hypothetical protein / location=Cvel_scaffold341:31758-33218(+) / protein_length=458 / sequence_SO=supercontig / SO=protein_coding / is_pseudo=false
MTVLRYMPLLLLPIPPILLTILFPVWNFEGNFTLEFLRIPLFATAIVIAYILPFFAPTFPLYMWIHRVAVVITCAGLPVAKVQRAEEQFASWMLAVIQECLLILSLDLYSFPRRPVLRIMFSCVFKSFSLFGFAAVVFVGAELLQSCEGIVHTFGIVLLAVIILLLLPLLICFLENDELKRGFRVLLFYPALVGKLTAVVIELAFFPFWDLSSNSFEVAMAVLALLSTLTSLIFGLLEVLRVVNLDDWGRKARELLAENISCFGDCVKEVRSRSRKLSTHLRRVSLAGVTALRISPSQTPSSAAPQIQIPENLNSQTEIKKHAEEQHGVARDGVGMEVGKRVSILSVDSFAGGESLSAVPVERESGGVEEPRESALFHGAGRLTLSDGSHSPFRSPPPDLERGTPTSPTESLRDPSHPHSEPLSFVLPPLATPSSKLGYHFGTESRQRGSKEERRETT